MSLKARQEEMVVSHTGMQGHAGGVIALNGSCFLFPYLFFRCKPIQNNCIPSICTVYPSELCWQLASHSFSAALENAVKGCWKWTADASEKHSSFFALVNFCISPVFSAVQIAWFWHSFAVEVQLLQPQPPRLVEEEVTLESGRNRHTRLVVLTLNTWRVRTDKLCATCCES